MRPLNNTINTDLVSSQAKRPSLGASPWAGVIPPYVREHLKLPAHVLPPTFVTWPHGETVMLYEYFSDTPRSS